MNVTMEKTNLGVQLSNMVNKHDNGLSKSCRLRYLPHDMMRIIFEECNDATNLSNFLLKKTNHKRSLLDFQIKAISNIVYRPDSIYTYTTGNVEDLVSLESMEVILRTDVEKDIGLAVINDLIPGSGKTIVSAISSILFANIRMDEIISQSGVLMREQRPLLCWGTRSDVNFLDKSDYTNTIVVLTAKHLTRQWIKEFKNAINVTGETDTMLYINPKVLPSSQKSVIILDSAMKLKKLNLKFVPCVIIDDYMADPVNNVIMKRCDSLPLYGRLIMISSDAGYTQSLVRGSSKTSVVRNMMSQFPLEDLMTPSQGTKCGLSLTSMSVLSSVDRQKSIDTMVKGMSDVDVEVYTMNYVPSMRGIFFGESEELSTTIIEDLAGIDSSSLKTIGDILQSVNTCVSTYHGVDMEKTIRLILISKKITEFLSSRQDCPVCLEEFRPDSMASILSPCWHFACKNCTRRVLNISPIRCPICRTSISGTSSGESSYDVSSFIENTSLEKKVNIFPTLSERINSYSGESPCFAKTCYSIISSLRDINEGITRILLIVPTSDFSVELMTQLEDICDIDMDIFKITGTKRAFDKALDLVTKSSNGNRVKVLCVYDDEYKEGLHGVDLFKLDAMICLGKGDSPDKLGRITRIPRMFEENKSTIRCFYLSCDI